MNLMRLKNRAMAKLTTLFPACAKPFIDAYRPRESEHVPWTPVAKLLREMKVAVVTTAGVHHADQEPFDMNDPHGDPHFRAIDIRRPLSSLMITHDYYDHSDADRDINIVFPVERLREFKSYGIIGRVADIHYGFMGHIDGQHVETLMKETAPEVARRLKADNVDVVLLTPG